VTLRSFALRAALAAAVLARPGAAPAQQITFRDLPWGTPADSVRPRLEALGYRHLRPEPGGGGTFAESDSVSLSTVLGGGRLVGVQLYRRTAAPSPEAAVRSLSDSLARALGAPARGAGGELSWTRGRSGLALTARPGPAGHPSILRLHFHGPGHEDEMARRGAFRGVFPALEEAWTILHLAADRRVALDTTSLRPQAPGVFRARFRTDYAQARRTMDVGRFDALDLHADYDCAGRRWRIAQAALLLEGRRVDGMTAPAAGWQPETSDPFARRQLEAVCEAADAQAAAAAGS
jgi:surface-adhesin protein E